VPSWIRVLLVALVVACVLPVTAASARPLAGNLRIAIDGAAASADFSRTADRSQVVVLQQWESDKVRALKAANPGVKVLMYRNLSGMSRADRWGHTGTGVTTQDAESHPEWYLRNTSGDRFTFKDYTYVWAADIGLRSFQERWLANVSARLEEADWDGVLVDDTNPTIMYHYDVGAVAKYPSDAAYSAATGSALAYIGPRLRAQGALVIPNFGTWRLYTETVGGWLKYVSGGMEEHFTKWGSSPAEGHITGLEWDSQLKMLKQVQAMGRLFLGVSHSSRNDEAAARYGWATTLLAADGSATFGVHDDYTHETWFPEYGYDLGAPAGKESANADGIHRRVFKRGLVLVNPTKGSVRVRFGRRYRGSGLGPSTGTVMRPHSGLVLVADGAARRSARARAQRRRRRAARRSVRVRVACKSGRRPCRRAITVALRAKGRRVVVGRRRVAVRRTTRVRVRISAKGHAALERGRHLRIIVRARR
jgi:hypothetical protein